MNNKSKKELAKTKKEEGLINGFGETENKTKRPAALKSIENI